MNQIFEIEAVRKKCLDLLRKEGRPMTTGEICLTLGLPFWAVQAGMDSARVGGLATFAGGAGWSVAQPAEPALQEAEEQQGGLL